MLPSDQSRIIEPVKFTYSLLGKTFKKEVKTIKNQGEKQIKATEEHRKQLSKSNVFAKKYDYNTEKNIPIPLKQKKIFNELTDERRDEILKLSKEVYNNLKCYYRGKNISEKNLNDFDNALSFLKKVRGGKITPGKAKKKKSK